MSRDCGWKPFSRNPRRHSVIHRRDAPRSIRGQRNPESRDGRPRSVRGQDPEYRNLKRKRRRKSFSLLKPVYMVFCIQIEQAPSRSMFCFITQTSRRRRKRNHCYFTTSRFSRGVRESYGEATAARDDSLGCRVEQAV